MEKVGFILLFGCFSLFTGIVLIVMALMTLNEKKEGYGLVGMLVLLTGTIVAAAGLTAILVQFK